MLQIAANWLEQEAKEIVEAKEAYMAEKCPAPDLSGDQAALMVPTKETHLQWFFISVHIVTFHVLKPHRSFAKNCIWLWTRSMRIDTMPRPKWKSQPRR